MKKVRKWIARLYDLPNAYRVLDIMDRAGCDIECVEDMEMWRIKPKWYVAEDEAKDLQRICLFKGQYKERSSLGQFLFYRVFFRQFREGCRIMKDWT